MAFFKDRGVALRLILRNAAFSPVNLAKLAGIAAAGFVYWRFRYQMSWFETGAIGVAVFFIILFWAAVEYCVKLRKQISDNRVELSRLRRKGVALRNYGQKKITNAKDFEKWHEDTYQWERDVVAAIGKISVADAEWFDILDSYPEKPREPLKKIFAPRKKDHIARYGQHDFQLARLGGMIRDLWGKSH
jgi:hypothetical protein